VVFEKGADRLGSEVWGAEAQAGQGAADFATLGGAAPVLVETFPVRPGEELLQSLAERREAHVVGQGMTKSFAGGGQESDGCPGGEASRQSLAGPIGRWGTDDTVDAAERVAARRDAVGEHQQRRAVLLDANGLVSL
jgi:hypothetical protein